MKIGAYTLKNKLIVAPMAGVTDKPFRRLCKQFGAGHAVSEMLSADKLLFGSKKSVLRANFDGEILPISAQIAGADPQQLAQAAQYQVANGAQIVDINMGCPVKKVCHKLAGSALLQNEALVKEILHTVVDAVDVPVTLKTRLGYVNGEENIQRIAQIAENAGIAALAIHGRTREDMYTGQARYALIKAVKAERKIPIIANGDIDSPQKAKEVLDFTGADAIMIGRAAQGRPWIFKEIAHFLATGECLLPPKVNDIATVLQEHLLELYAFYGEYSGTRIARKHIAWYSKGLHGGNVFRQQMYTLNSSAEQAQLTHTFFNELAKQSERLVYADAQQHDAQQYADHCIESGVYHGRLL